MPDTITNPAGAFGYTAATDKAFSLDRPFKSNETAITIAAGDTVIITSGGLVEQSATGDDANLAIGVAREAIAPGKVGLVTILGIATANVESGVAAGDSLGRSATTAGRANTATTGAGGIFATALSAAVSNQATVWIGGASN
jgi:hypothetical protein